MAVTSVKRKVVSTGDGEITSRDLYVIARRFYRIYGKAVIEGRALVDYRDGLKPVHRRILWAMKQLNLRPGANFLKCARVVGDTMGKYHPHGDSSIYGALVNMANRLNQPVAMVDGNGNFGNISGDPAAAMRYTECRLTKFTWETMLDDAYLAVTPMMPNYDGNEKEPLILPALLPTAVIQGTSGIAFAATSMIPPLHLEPLIPLMERHIKNGTPIGPKAFKKAVKFNWPYGSQLRVEEEVFDRWLTTGFGPLRFEPVYEIDPQTRTITFTEVPPYFNWDGVVNALAEMNAPGSGKQRKTRSGVQKEAKERSYNTSIGRIKMTGLIDNVMHLPATVDKKTGIIQTRFVVKLRRNVPAEDFSGYCEPVINAFAKTLPAATNYNNRTGTEEDKTDFEGGSIPNLLEKWCTYRTDLESRAQDHISRELTKEIAMQELLMLAINNMAVLKRALDSRDPVKVVQEGLTWPKTGENITLEQANTIVHRQFVSLTRMSGDQIAKKLRDLKTARTTARGHRDNPGPKVMADMNSALPLLKTKAA